MQVVWACFWIPCLPKNERTGWCACICLQTKAKLALLVLDFLISLGQGKFEKYARNKECSPWLEMLLAERWIYDVHIPAVPAAGVRGLLEEHLTSGEGSSHLLRAIIYCLWRPAGDKGSLRAGVCVWDRAVVVTLPGADLELGISYCPAGLLRWVCIPVPTPLLPCTVCCMLKGVSHLFYYVLNTFSQM